MTIHRMAMSAGTKVAVVIPLHNRRELIQQTLESLSPEWHPGVLIEPIVVDDGSTDGGPDVIARRFPHVRLLSQTHCGAPAARNRGIRSTDAAAVLLLDSDDLIEPEFFEPRLAALERYPAADAAYGPWDMFTGAGAFTEHAVIAPHARYPIDTNVERRGHLTRLLRGWYIPSHAILWRATALQRIEGQDESLTVNQDVDLLFRALLTGDGIVGCDGGRALYRQHAGAREGTIGVTARKIEDEVRVRERFVEALRASGAMDDEARLALAHYCFNRWRALRREAPDAANRVLALSLQLAPDLRLDGRWPLRALGRVLGPTRAIVVRDYVARLGWEGFVARRRQSA